MLILGPVSVEAYVSVKGYTKKDGTYVAPHVRSNPNGLKYDNYGYTPSQGLYNKTYGTRGSEWDTPTYITDPNYYQGKALYDSGLSGSTYSSSYNSYNYSYPTTPTCPSNSYYDGVSSCKCNYGYLNSGGSCVSTATICYSQTGYNSSYDSLSNTCKCDYGYVIGSSGQCTSASSFCTNSLGLMSQYNNLSKKCECVSGYTYNGSSCMYKTISSSGASVYSANSYTCPLNSHTSPNDSTKCQCDFGYQVNSTKTACIVAINNTNNQACINSYGVNSSWDGTKTSSGLLNCGCQSGYSWNSSKTSCVYNAYTSPTYTPPFPNNEDIGKKYFLINKTCVGLSGDQYNKCISYAYNH